MRTDFVEFTTIHIIAKVESSLWRNVWAAAGALLICWLVQVGFSGLLRPPLCHPLVVLLFVAKGEEKSVEL